MTITPSDKSILPATEGYTGTYIDLAELFKFQRGSSSFIKEVITLFIEDTPDDFAQMKVAIETNDYITLERVAHRMAPSASFVGSPLLMEKLRRIQTLAVAHTDIAYLREALMESEELSQKIIEELTSFRNTYLTT